MNIAWKNVESSNINAMSYDDSACQLYVQFKAGTVYRYSNVEQQVAEEITSADSIGSTFNRLIKKQPEVYPFEKLN